MFRMAQTTPFDYLDAKFIAKDVHGWLISSRATRLHVDTSIFFWRLGASVANACRDCPTLRDLPSFGEREGAGDKNALLPCTMRRPLLAKSRTAGQDILREITRPSTGWLLVLSGTLRLFQILKTSCR